MQQNTTPPGFFALFFVPAKKRANAGKFSFPYVHTVSDWAMMKSNSKGLPSCEICLFEDALRIDTRRRIRELHEPVHVI